MELRKTTAVITGTSGLLGRNIALALAEHGCNCICHYNKNGNDAEQTVRQIHKTGQKAMAVKADLTKMEQINNLFERANKIGLPQILINSAAVFEKQSLDSVTFDDARKILDINLIAPIMTSKVFAKAVEEAFGSTGKAVGKIINISDVGGIRPWAGYALYCSSKAGLIGATKSLAKELAPSICVNSIAPGLVTWHGDLDEDAKKRQLSFIPVGRKAEPKEIADAAIFLLKNDYITGQVLNVDGGRCI